MSAVMETETEKETAKAEPSTLLERESATLERER